MSARQPGKTRRKLAHMLGEHFGIVVNPEDIKENRSPYYAQMGIARWYVDIVVEGRRKYVYSFATMAEVIEDGVQVCKEEGENVEIA